MGYKSRVDPALAPEPAVVVPVAGSVAGSVTAAVVAVLAEFVNRNLPEPNTYRRPNRPVLNLDLKDFDRLADRRPVADHYLAVHHWLEPKVAAGSNHLQDPAADREAPAEPVALAAEAEDHLYLCCHSP
jgi:hypothetical protein